MPETFWDFNLKLIKDETNIGERLEDVIDELCSLSPFSSYMYKLKHEFFWSHLKKRKMTKKELQRRDKIILLLEENTRTAKKRITEINSIINDIHFGMGDEEEDDAYRNKVIHSRNDWIKRLAVTTALAIYTIGLE